MRATPATAPAWGLETEIADTIEVLPANVTDCENASSLAKQSALAQYPNHEKTFRFPSETDLTIFTKAVKGHEPQNKLAQLEAGLHIFAPSHVSFKGIESSWATSREFFDAWEETRKKLGAEIRYKDDNYWHQQSQTAALGRGIATLPEVQREAVYAKLFEVGLNENGVEGRSSTTCQTREEFIRLTGALTEDALAIELGTRAEAWIKANMSSEAIARRDHSTHVRGLNKAQREVIARFARIYPMCVRDLAASENTLLETQAIARFAEHCPHFATNGKDYNGDGSSWGQGKNHLNDPQRNALKSLQEMTRTMQDQRDGRVSICATRLRNLSELSATKHKSLVGRHAGKSMFASMGTGALTGLTVGSVVPGIGNGVGAGVGAAVGLVAGTPIVKKITARENKPVNKELKQLAREELVHARAVWYGLDSSTQQRLIDAYDAAKQHFAGSDSKTAQEFFSDPDIDPHNFDRLKVLRHSKTLHWFQAKVGLRKI